MKTPVIKTLLLATIVAALGLTARAQYPGAFPTTNAFTAPAAFKLLTRSNSIGPGAALFGEDLYLNSTLGVTNIFTGWAAGPVPVASKFDPMGGQIRVVYLGKTAGWTNDFGYVTIPPLPHSAYYPLATNINGVNITSGYETLVSYGAGQTVDFFVNSGGSLGQGGLFYAFGLGNEYAGMDNTMHVHWNSAVVDIGDGPLTTYFIGYEDTRQKSGISFADQDFNDLMIAIQFIPGSAVPEPSTYGMIGAAVLLALVGYKRFKSKGKIAAQA